MEKLENRFFFFNRGYEITTTPITRSKAGHRPSNEPTIQNPGHTLERVTKGKCGVASSTTAFV